MDWQNKATVKRGNIGEIKVQQYLQSQGYITYKPTIDGSHPFDLLCAAKDKSRIFVAEVKTKPRRKYYEDNGVDIQHFREYQRITTQHNMELYIFFVDEIQKKIYYGELKDLIKKAVIEYKGKNTEYPLEQNGIIYFPLCHTKDLCSLGDDASEELLALSTRNYSYDDLEDIKQ